MCVCVRLRLQQKLVNTADVTVAIDSYVYCYLHLPLLSLFLSSSLSLFLSSSPSLFPPLPLPPSFPLFLSSSPSLISFSLPLRFLSSSLPSFSSPSLPLLPSSSLPSSPLPLFLSFPLSLPSYSFLSLAFFPSFS